MNVKLPDRGALDIRIALSVKFRWLFRADGISPECLHTTDWRMFDVLSFLLSCSSPFSRQAVRIAQCCAEFFLFNFACIASLCLIFVPHRFFGPFIT